VRSDCKIHALLATARIANVPSVVSNLGVGILLGVYEGGIVFFWPWGLMVAAVLFYISGNFLNDWMDRDWDKEKRPERALPRGMFSATAYLTTALAGMTSGLVISAFYGWLSLVVAGVLVSLIVLYTKVHKKAAWSVIPMGMCRACLQILGYVAMCGNLAAPMIFPALGLLVYVIGLSLSARWEARGDLPVGQKWIARGLLFGAGVFAVIPLVIIPSNVTWIGLIPFAVWLIVSVTIYQSPVSAHVSALLAGIPLIDWILLLPTAIMSLNLDLVKSDEPIYLISLFLAPSCFVIGRLLQRVAPAT
jgi:4-hydroxybenzoate polyprenyltransferase